MLELGEKSELYHKKIGEYVAQKNIDYLLSYGNHSRIVTNTARSLNIDARHYESKNLIIERLKTELNSGDIVLVKGSRGNKLENVVEEII